MYRNKKGNVNAFLVSTLTKLLNFILIACEKNTSVDIEAELRRLTLLKQYNNKLLIVNPLFLFILPMKIKMQER